MVLKKRVCNGRRRFGQSCRRNRLARASAKRCRYPPTLPSYATLLRPRYPPMLPSYAPNTLLCCPPTHPIDTLLRYHPTLPSYAPDTLLRPRYATMLL
eukprot:2368973-Rhodomonas_salina.2